MAWRLDIPISVLHKTGTNNNNNNNNNKVTKTARERRWFCLFVVPPGLKRKRKKLSDLW
jgi:hypothetical protein